LLATRDVFERAMRERLAAACPNVTVRCGSAVDGLEHGKDAARGCVTGGNLIPADAPSLASSRNFNRENLQNL